MSLRDAILGGQFLFLILLILMAAFAATGEREAPAPPSVEAGLREAPRPLEAPDPPGLEHPSRDFEIPIPPPLVFPLAEKGLLTDSFGDPRPGERLHQGVDIMAPKMTPVLAAADGTVIWAHDEIGGSCCDLALRHDDDWTSRYFHLNNDTAGTDDGQGYGIAPGLAVGSRVEAGTVIGWVGDSGNAEATAPHLHFELLGPDRRPVDPYPALLSALRRDRQATSDSR